MSFSYGGSSVSSTSGSSFLSQQTERQRRISIQAMPDGWAMSSDQIDWTEQFHGSCGALKRAVKTGKATLPTGGVYIRSSRLDTYYKVIYEYQKSKSPTSRSKQKELRKKISRKNSSKTLPVSNGAHDYVDLVNVAADYISLVKRVLHEAPADGCLQSQKVASSGKKHRRSVILHEKIEVDLNTEINQWAETFIEESAQLQRCKRGKYHPWDAGTTFLQTTIQRWQRCEMPLDLHEAKIHAYMDKSTMILKSSDDQWSESQYAEAKLYANKPQFMCHRLGGKPLHVVIVGPSASGKTYSQTALLRQLLPEASVHGRRKERLRTTPHEQMLHNPVVFVSIDGENLREVEKVDQNAPHDVKKIAEKLSRCSRQFKKTLRLTLQRMGFNTIEPTVHIKGMRRSINHMIRINAQSKVIGRSRSQVNLAINELDDDSDSDESISSASSHYFSATPPVDTTPWTPRSPVHSRIKKKLSKKLSKRILAEQKNLSLLSVTWQNRVGAGNWENYSPENSKTLTDHYRKGLTTVDLGRFVVDLRLMNQKVKDGDEFSQVRALNHRGKPLPRLQELTIQAMQEEKQRVEENIFPPCVFKLVFVYASYQHTCAAGEKRAKLINKAPPSRGSWMRGVMGVKSPLNARIECKDWEHFFDNESEFVIIDNQFGYLKQPPLFLSLPASVVVENKLHKGYQSFSFSNQAIKTDPLFETTSGLLTPWEYRQISEINSSASNVMRISVFGKNDSGQLGLGNKKKIADRVMEIDIEQMGWPKHVIKVAVGTSHTLLSTADSAVYGFGSNTHGQLGMKPRRVQTRPVRVEGLLIGRHHALAAGEHTSFVGTATSLHSAGRTLGGLLGFTGSDRRTTFGSCEGLQGMSVLQVCCGQNHSVALVEHADSGLGSVWGCGLAPFVQPTKKSPCSDGGVDKFRPGIFDEYGTESASMVDITKITCGSDRTLVLDKHHNLWVSIHRRAATGGSKSVKAPFKKVCIPTLGKSKGISHIDSQSQKLVAVTDYPPRSVFNIDTSNLVRPDDINGVDESGVQSAHCHSTRTFILAKSGLLYASAGQTDAARKLKLYQPMIRWDGKDHKTRVWIQHPQNCQVSTSCTANHSVILERQPSDIVSFRKSRQALLEADKTTLANIAKHRSDFREVAIHGAAEWVHSRYGQLSTSKSGACEVVSLASAMPWLQIQSSDYERRALQFLSRVAPGTDDTIFQRCRDIVIQAYTMHKKHIRTRTYQVTSRGKDVALIRASSLDSRWLRILTADRQWVPLRNTQMADLCSQFPTTFLQPGVAALKVKPKGDKSEDIQELKFIASQKGMWGRYNAKGGSKVIMSTTQWYHCPNWKAPKDDQPPQLVGAKCISVAMGDVDKIRHSFHMVKYLRIETSSRDYWDVLSEAQIEDMTQDKPDLFVKRHRTNGKSRHRLHGTWMHKHASLRVGILLTEDTRSFLASFGVAMSMTASIHTDLSGRTHSTMRSYDSLPATATTDASVPTDDVENMVPLHALGDAKALGGAEALVGTEGNTIDDECLDV